MGLQLVSKVNILELLLTNTIKTLKGDASSVMSSAYLLSRAQRMTWKKQFNQHPSSCELKKLLSNTDTTEPV